MKLRILSAVVSVAGAIVICAPLAHAAITVLGSGLAQDCYQAAEYGSDTRDGIETCSYALDEQALSLKDRAATYINRGILRSRSEDPNGALNDYDQGLATDGSLGEGYVDRGATLIVLKRYDEAYTDIHKGIDLGARRPQIAYYDLGIVDEALGNIRGAYEDYKKAVEIEPDFALANEQLARFKVVRKPASGT